MICVVFAILLRTAPSGALGMHASSRTRTLSMTNGLPVSVGLKHFQQSLSSKPAGCSFYAIDRSTQLSVNLACSLLGSAFGYEGQHVFPTVFTEDTQAWQPSEHCLAAIGKLIHEKDVKAHHVIELICSDAGIASNAHDAGPIAAGWSLGDNWVQMVGRPYTCISGGGGAGAALAREQLSFSAAPVSRPTPSELSQLLPSASATSGVRFSAAPHQQLLSILDPAASDSHALLHCAASCINRALALDLDRPQTAYSLVANGAAWRFAAFQLNTLDIEGALGSAAAAKNAAWVYESELFIRSSSGEGVRVNPEPLRIAMDILTSGG